MEFWKWYFRGILKIPRACISPWGEYVWGCVILFVLSLFLGIAFSPFYLFLTISIGATIGAHGLWRALVKK